MTRENLTQSLEELHRGERPEWPSGGNIQHGRKPPKVIAVKGQKKVCYRCSGNKSQLTVPRMLQWHWPSHAMPPFVIFDETTKPSGGEMPGTRYGLSDSGWPNETCSMVGLMTCPVASPYHRERLGCHFRNLRHHPSLVCDLRNTPLSIATWGDMPCKYTRL